MHGLIASLLFASTQPAHPITEWLAPPDIATLHSAETIHNDLKLKIVYVGRDETLERWTGKLTTWSYPAIALAPDLFEQHARGIYDEVTATCPGIRASPLRVFSWAGRRAAEYVAVCPLLPETGRQDIYIVRMVAGETSYLASAVTFAQAPSEAEVRRARRRLDGLIRCTAATTHPACLRSVPPDP